MSVTGAKNIGFEDGRFFLSDEDPIDDAGCSEEDTLCRYGVRAAFRRDLENTLREATIVADLVGGDAPLAERGRDAFPESDFYSKLLDKILHVRSLMTHRLSTANNLFGVNWWSSWRTGLTTRHYKIFGSPDNNDRFLQILNIFLDWASVFPDFLVQQLYIRPVGRSGPRHVHNVALETENVGKRTAQLLKLARVCKGSKKALELFFKSRKYHDAAQVFLASRLRNFVRQGPLFERNFGTARFIKSIGLKLSSEAFTNMYSYVNGDPDYDVPVAIVSDILEGTLDIKSVAEYIAHPPYLNRFGSGALCAGALASFDRRLTEILQRSRPRSSRSFETRLVYDIYVQAVAASYCIMGGVGADSATEGGSKRPRIE